MGERDALGNGGQGRGGGGGHGFRSIPFRACGGRAGFRKAPASGHAPYVRALESSFLYLI